MTGYVLKNESMSCELDKENWKNVHEHLLVNIESISIENTRTMGITIHIYELSIYKEDEYLIWSSIISDWFNSIVDGETNNYVRPSFKLVFITYSSQSWFSIALINLYLFAIIFIIT